MVTFLTVAHEYGVDHYLLESVEAAQYWLASWCLDNNPEGIALSGTHYEIIDQYFSHPYYEGDYDWDIYSEDPIKVISFVAARDEYEAALGKNT